MKISRRSFLKYAGASSLVLASCGIGTSGSDDRNAGDGDLSGVLPPGTGTRVVWLIGSGCGGCSVSFLNRISSDAPETAADVLMDVAVVGFHPMLMASSGKMAVAAAESFYAAGEGGYVLVVEGGVPTAFDGKTCVVWRDSSGNEVTMLDAVKKYATNASAILSIGTCASYGGVSGASPNPTGVVSVSSATGMSAVNIPGCPPHPDWIVAGLAALISDSTLALDAWGRPESIYSANVHVQCPRNVSATIDQATTFGVDGECLRKLGCRGPITIGSCPTSLWNQGRNWCVDANSPCVGCTDSTFPQVGLREPV